MTHRLFLGLAAIPVALLTVVLLPAAPASAHPLGNFSVNQYLGLTFHPDRVEAEAVIDTAEIPTLQDRPSIDADSNGSVSDAERTTHASKACRAFASAVLARVGVDSLVWTVTRSSFVYSNGARGLEVSRLDCALTAPAALAGGAEIRVDNSYLADRVGWREMTAVGQGIRLVDSPLPGSSVSQGLRDYPQDLLASALDVRSATVRVSPGTGTDGAAAVVGGGGDPLSRWMAAVDRRFSDLAGGPTVTPLVGLLAVGLALLLGAGHAALPGHGKTVLAAYLAGKRGRPRDALGVAGTVTLTHTGGVLAIGLLITAGTALAGEQILAWLGLVSGAVVLVVGATMLVGILRRRRHDRAHSHDHDHGEQGEHGEHGGHGGHDHHRGHTHGGHDHHRGHTHGGHDHHRGHAHGGGHHHHGRSGRWGLAGIGVAGGLVPSPSALVVLLAAIGLGRTGFGVLLVVAYGLGMAATLTGAGLLLLALQRRVARRCAEGRLTSWVARATARLNAATPAASATLVLIVGAGLAARAVAGVL